MSALGDLRFTGNDHYPNTDNFKQYIIGQTRARFPSSRKDLPYVETDVQKGTDLVQRFYLSEGYLKAQVGTPAVAYTDNRTRANLTIPIAEGPRYRFGEVKIEGPLVFPEAEVRGLIADQIPLPYTTPRVDAMQRKLEDFYKKKGYYNALVLAVSDPVSAGPDGRVAATFQVTPGPLFHFDGSRIVGTDRLKPEYLRNRFKKLSGKVYDPAALDEVYQEMIRTGLFAQLRVEPVPQDDNTLRLDIGVKEAMAKEVGFSLGYGTYEGVIVGVELRDRDFLGTGRPLTLNLDYSTRTLLGELLYVDHYLFESDVQMRLSLHAETRDLSSYTKDEIGASAQFSRAITKQFKTSIFVESNHDEITAASVRPFYVGPKELHGGRRRGDGEPGPARQPAGTDEGIHHQRDVRRGVQRARGQRGFRARDVPRNLPAAAAGQDAVPGGVPRGHHQAVRRESGGHFEVDTDRDPKTPDVALGSTLPIDERFFLGGSTTVRSFVERELGPYDHATGGFIGGQAYTVTNVEYQFPLLKSVADLKGAAFLDAGNLRSRAEQFGFSDERYGIGLGIRYNLPIGPSADRLRREPGPAPARARRGVPVQLRVGVLTGAGQSHPI